MIVRRRRNDSGFISEWVVIPKIDGVDHVKEYWIVDVSVGIIIEPYFNGSLSELKDIFEMEETEESLRSVIDNAMKGTMKELFSDVKE